MKNKRGEVITIEFTKNSWMRFISHLDLLRLFQRALRRAGIRVKLSEGFNPHSLIFFKRALKLGIESESEFADIVVSENVPLGEFKKRLDEQLPEGIRIKKVNEDTTYACLSPA